VLAADVDGVSLPVSPVDRVVAECQRDGVRQRAAATAAAAGDDHSPVSAVQPRRLDVPQLDVGPVDAPLGDVERQTVGPVQVGVDDRTT